ncbi:MAG: ABC transporter permease [Clostridia bacterium]
MSSTTAPASGSVLRLVVAGSFAALLAAVFAAFTGANPVQGLRAFFVLPFLSRTVFLSMLESAAPLGLCALGAISAFRAGHFSLGGEGQAYSGALVAALVGAAGSGGLLGLGSALLAGTAAGVLVALLPALGKRFADADVLLTSFLISYAVVLGADWAIAVPLRDATNNLVALPPVQPSALLPRLALPSSLTPMPLVFTGLCLLSWFFFEHTRTGAMMDLFGRNRLFAVLQGYPVKLFAWAPILAAGAFHGLAGASLALGANGTAIRGMSGGIGWSAIGVALVAGNKPAAVPLAALLFAWLDAGSRQASILTDVNPDASLVIKALVLILITARPGSQLFRGFLSRSTLPRESHDRFPMELSDKPQMDPPGRPSMEARGRGTP